MAFPMDTLAPTVPLTHLSISILIYACALGAQKWKWVWSAALLVFQCLALKTSTHWPNNGIDSLWGLLVCIWISQSFSMLYLEDRNLALGGDLVPTKQPWYSNAWKTWNNPRLLGTRREELCTSKSFWGCQSRSIFARVRIAKLTLYWVLSQYGQPLVIPGAFRPFQPTDFDEIRQTYFRRIFSESDCITTRETMLRATFAMFWAWGAYVMVDAAHSALSIVFVLVLRADPPQQWPPIYGSLREISSLRGFWGKFWHRLVVLPYSNFGKCIAEKGFRFRPGSLPHKLTVAFTIFCISGVAHAVVSYRLGDRCGWHLDIWWFCMNFVASVAETAVCSVIPRQIVSGVAFPIPRLSLALRKTLGFVWVFLFFFWSVPKWQYPKAYCLFAEAPAAMDPL